MKLPERFERIIRAAEERVLAASSGIKALVIIGSVAKGDWSEDSDVDVVCIVEGKLNREHRWQLMQSAPSAANEAWRSASQVEPHPLSHHIKS
jgi:predicted nucleotidyltransferase